MFNEPAQSSDARGRSNLLEALGNLLIARSFGGTAEARL